MHRRLRQILFWLALATALHALVWAAWRLRAPEPLRVEAAKSAPVRLLSAEQVRRALDRAAKRPLPPPAPEPKTGRIVSLPPPPERQRPRQTDRLAAHDHAADKETISRNRQLEDAPPAERASNGPRATPRAAEPPPGRPQPQPRFDPAARASDWATPVTPRVVHGPPAAAPATARPPAGPRKLPSLADLLPPAVALAQHGGGAPVADVSESDAEEGETTALNARAFRYASFFERMSERLRRHWRVREAVDRMRRRGRPLIEHETHKTLVHVVLGADGELRSAAVVRPSGFDELDEAGRQAFVTAAPFLHPPKGLLAGRPEVAFDFEFALSVAASSVFGGLDWQGVPP